jgi:hypothetical protein
MLAARILAVPSTHLYQSLVFNPAHSRKRSFQMARYIVQLNGSEDQLIDADEMVIDPRSKAYNLYKSGIGLVASFGIGPGVKVTREVTPEAAAKSKS